MLVYTSEQKAWMVSIKRSPPPWRASAKIAQSRLAALLVFMAAIASAVSSRLGRSEQVGRSLLAGGGISDKLSHCYLSKVNCNCQRHPKCLVTSFQHHVMHEKLVFICKGSTKNAG